MLGHGPQGGFVLGQGPQRGFMPRSPRPGSRRPLEAVCEAGGWQQSSTAAPRPRWGRAGGAATHRGGGGPGLGEQGWGSPGVPGGRTSTPGPCAQRAGCSARPVSEHPGGFHSKHRG